MEEGLEKDFVLNQAVYFVNSEFGGDIGTLSKAKQLYDQVNATKTSLEQQLSFASSEAPSRIDQAVQDVEESAKKIERFSAEQEHLSGDISNHLADVGPMVKNLSSLTAQIRELERYTKYLQWIARVEDLSSDIQSALLINSTERSVTQFAEMAELAKMIQGSQCRHLVKFVNDTVVFWYRILKDKFASEFDEVLKAWRWPFIISSVKTPQQQNVAEHKDKLEPLFNHLLHLQLPDGLSSEGQPSHPFLTELPGWRPLLLPLQLMLLPLRKRFKYHFYGKKQTNNVAKPEWYFTQVLGWIKDHKEFLSSKIQPILEKAGLAYVDSLAEFSRGLIVLVMEKMLTDLQQLLYDDHLLSHLVDEVLAFDRELRSSYGYPTGQLGCLHILTREDAFEKWIAIEKKFALEKMDAMLSSASAWHSQYRDISDADDSKVPECGESFMTLLVTITERYKPLPSSSHKLHFLDLQLELLDDYRIRLLQLRSGEAAQPLGECYCAMLNTVSCITEALKEWSELSFFLQLQYYKAVYQSHEASVRHADKTDQGDGEAGVAASATTPVTPVRDKRSTSMSLESQVSASLASEEFDESKLETLDGSVFDEMIELFERMRAEMLNNVVHYVSDDIKARSRPYRKDKWLALPSQKDFVSLGLSSSACEMLLVLKDRLHQVQHILSKKLFHSFWQKLAEDLNRYIFEELILCNHFNEGGAAQLHFDMSRNLFPLFGQYTTRPENYFKDVKEACTLLTLATGSAMLLKEVLYQALHEARSDPSLQVTDPIASLQETGIYKLSPEEAELVLSLRTNTSAS